LEKTARFSNIIAALSMTKLGCMTAIPKAKDAEKIMKAYEDRSQSRKLIQQQVLKA
jgi:sugar/nucleoside kinase (ribokinase family)